MKTSYIIVLTFFLLIGCNPPQENKELLVPEEKVEENVKIDTIIYPDLFSVNMKGQNHYDGGSPFELNIKKEISDLGLWYKDEAKSIFHYQRGLGNGFVLEDRKNDLRIAVHEFGQDFTNKSIQEIYWLTEAGTPKYLYIKGLAESLEAFRANPDAPGIDTWIEFEWNDTLESLQCRKIALKDEKMIDFEEITYPDIIKWDKLLKEGRYEYLTDPAPIGNVIGSISYPPYY